MKSRSWPALAVLSLVVGAAALGANLQRDGATAKVTPLLGKRLENVVLDEPARPSAQLHSTLGSSETLLILLDEDAALSCANLPLELRIIRRDFPELTVTMVGLAEDRTFLESYFARELLRRTYFISESSLRTLVGQRTLPLAILVDSAGRIVLVDERNGPQATEFPISKVLNSLRNL